MPTHIVTLNGEERDVKIGTFNHQDVANGRAVFSCTLLADPGSPTWRPSLADEVLWTEDATARFGGFIDRLEEQGLGGQELDEFETEIVCISYDSLADRRFVTETFAAGTTLEAALITLEAYVTDYGASLDPGQVTGPTFTEDLSFDAELLSSVLDKLSEITGYLWKFAPDKTFSMYVPGTTAAPFDIAEADDPAHYVGDLKVTRSREKYYNRVIGKLGENVVVPKSQSFVGDGSEDTFQLDYAIQGPFAPVATEDQAVAYGVVDYVDGIETVAGQLAPAGYQWEYDPDALTITRRAGPVANLVAFTFRYDVQFPITVTAEDSAEIAANGLSEVAVSYPTVYDKAVGQQLVDALLAKALAIKVEVRYQTYDTGVEPGQTQDITESYRDLSGEFLITEVRGSNPANGQDILRSVTAVGGTAFRGSYRDLIRAWLGGGGKSASAGTGPTVSTGGATAAPPNRAIQFNRGGIFGGNQYALFYDDETSIVVGELSSITAASFKGCQAFGYDCHIADP